MDMRVYRWDLDKTYLETDFDSFMGLVRSATEPASEKISVPGAPALLRGLSAAEDAKVYFLSGSPTQMRVVLEEKLRLDGVRYESLTLKDNLGNLRRGRVRAIRGQFDYKLPHLLESRLLVPRHARESLFGDDAEVDAIVYSVYADVLAGRVRPDELARIMRAAGAYDDRVDAAMAALAQIPPADCVDRIFIRLARRHNTGRFAPLGNRVAPIHSWWQAALVLVGDGQLSPDVAGEVLAACIEGEGLSEFAVCGLSQDIVARGLAPADAIAAVPMDAPLRTAMLASLRRLGTTHRSPGPVPADEPVDYPALIRGWKAED